MITIKYISNVKLDVCEKFGIINYHTYDGIIGEVHYKEFEGIPESAFAYNEDLISISFSEGICNIPIKCFFYCKNLKYIKLPEGLTSINYFAFTMCENLEIIYLPTTVTYINPQAFLHVKHKGLLYLGNNYNYIISKLNLSNFLYGYNMIADKKYIGVLYYEEL